MSTISQAFGSNSCVRAEFTPEFSIERKKATKRQPLTNQSVTERKKKGDNQGHIIPTLHHSTFVLSSVWHWPFCKYYENVFLGLSFNKSDLL